MTVTFFPVSTAQHKLHVITHTAYAHFQQSDPLLFLVPDETAWKFLDELLWKMPPHAFLPHPSRLIHIRLQLDPAISSLFNLSPHPISADGLKQIYELDDTTSPEKKQLSDARYQSYKAIGKTIVSENLS